MFTELWTGWFQHWSTAKPTRPTADLAFATARWIAKGGTYVGYYMWHGGTNFGRWGSDFKTTSYDYDAPITEYGFRASHKYSHLRQLHLILQLHANLILNHEPAHKSFGSRQEAHIYSSKTSGNSIAFLSNTDEDRDATVDFAGKVYRLPRWTVLILVSTQNRPYVQVFSTSSIQYPSRKEVMMSTRSDPSTSDLRLHVDFNDISWIKEPVGIWAPSSVIESKSPMEQIRLTGDETDHLWYIYQDLEIPDDANDNIVITIDPPTDVLYVYLGENSVTPREVTTMNVNQDQKGLLFPVKESRIVIPVEEIKRLQTDSSRLTLNILSVTMGLLNYGYHYDFVEKGISGHITYNGKDLTKGTWFHQIGLKGERDRASSFFIKSRDLIYLYGILVFRSSHHAILEAWRRNPHPSPTDLVSRDNPL
jgi:hypothetical protein